jgi:hypothetical protein
MKPCTARPRTVSLRGCKRRTVGLDGDSDAGTGSEREVGDPHYRQLEELIREAATAGRPATSRLTYGAIVLTRTCLGVRPLDSRQRN